MPFIISMACLNPFTLIKRKYNVNVIAPNNNTRTIRGKPFILVKFLFLILLLPPRAGIIASIFFSFI